MSLHTQFSNDGKQLIITIKGRFDFSLVQEFRQAYASVGSQQPLVIIDLRETEYLDSSALGMLLNMRKSLGNSIQGVNLINCRPEVRRILEISRFDKMFVIE
ncbi:STAS domain-containing protein [Idiomarina xiamenensis]|uniref:Anti-anti-sigma regulatory factor n=1 Tax=Idiomarina xiamenensis 10-D-4 TaxID=740709 RepID=K2KPE6_9GAMM|nr:STAS domain-containing protein [Idiomarina xiamenensis]EKE84274.1 anti-anti-sigma regulatory factor [Idiomarina xiamenensis 10-D-4]